jgi:MoaA/NifB/PqqE/SkfB family radical SAM enzyme
VPPSIGKSIRRKRLRQFLRCWALPYLRSRLLPGFRPILGCVFTEWKCNLDCWYCHSHDNARPGLDEATGDSIVDWLRSEGCRVVALMGGEPLLRPAFVTRLVARSAARGLYVYLPTNGRLLTPDLTDRLGEAGIASVNLSVDGISERPGMPKALNAVRPQLDYLVKRQHRYGYTVFLSINVTRFNLDDVRPLTEFAREQGIGTSYHLCDSPEDRNRPAPADPGPVDGLLDYLIARRRAGYPMLNSERHLEAMKRLLRGSVPPWPCRAGRNMIVCRADGTLAPCYPMVETPRDWGVAGCPLTIAPELDQLKRSCSRSCYSTVAYLLADYYDLRRIGGEVSARLRGALRRETASSAPD